MRLPRTSSPTGTSTRAMPSLPTRRGQCRRRTKRSADAADSGTPGIWEMNGTTPTSKVALFDPGPSWHLIGSGDFNGDGMSDLLWQNNDGTPAVWLMNGTAPTSGVALPNPGPAWHNIGAEDVNGDRRADIVWQNNDGTPAIWLMNGTTPTSMVGLPNPSSSWHLIMPT
jgi:hypothetical protein